MSAFDNSLAEYLTQSLGEEDENDISRKKHVNWQPLKEKHSANFLKKNSDKIAKLRNEISDLRVYLYTCK